MKDSKALLISIIGLLAALLLIGIVFVVRSSRQPTVEELRLQFQRAEQAKQENQKAAEDAAIEAERRWKQEMATAPNPRWIGKEDEAAQEIARLKSRLESGAITHDVYEQDIQAEGLDKFPH